MLGTKEHSSSVGNLIPIILFHGILFCIVPLAQVLDYFIHTSCRRKSEADKKRDEKKRIQSGLMGNQAAQREEGGERKQEAKLSIRSRDPEQAQANTKSINCKMIRKS